MPSAKTPPSLSNDNLNSGDANITSAITNVDNQSWLDVIVDIKKTLNNLSEFRKELLESEISKFNHSLEISQLLVSAWQKINQYHLPVSSDEADSMFKKAVGAFNLGKNYLQLATDRNQSINNLNPASLKFGDKTVRLSAEESNQQKYFLSQPNAYFGINLGEEAYLQNPTRIRQPRYLNIVQHL